MNALLIILGLSGAFFSWILAVSISRGEFRYKSRGHMGGTGSSHVKRSEQPAVFWFFAALHAGIILYITSLVIELSASGGVPWTARHRPRRSVDLSEANPQTAAA